MYRFTWKLKDESNDSCGPMTGEGSRIGQAASNFLESMDFVFELNEQAMAEVLHGMSHVTREFYECRDAHYEHLPDFTMPETAFTITLEELPEE